MIKMKNIYLLDVTDLPDPQENKRALSGIPDWRCAHILKYMRACDRKLSLGAWRLMEETLKNHGFSAKNVTIGKNGKLECEGVYFNLSHSGDRVLCAINDTPVGCDIEKVIEAPMEVAERVFTKKENRYISGAENDTETNYRFFRLWTMKESYMKMTGEGLSLSPDRIEINLDDLTVMRDGILQYCTIQNCTVEGYEISVCLGKN